MDAVRFGRALGFGARQAAKTVARAVDAARAENPSPNPPAAPAPNPVPAAAAAPRPVASAHRASAPDVAASRTATHPAPQTVRGATSARRVQDGFTRFKASAIEPAVRLSGVLWLEVTGVFFAIFALAAANGVWRLRTELRPALTHPVAHGSLLGALAIFALFAYFSISSFVRAHKRQRRR